jgi:hypothetical protein
VLSDFIISGSVLLLILAAMMGIDPRVRLYVDSFINEATPAAAHATASEAARAVVTAIADMSVDHAPLMIFVVAATVLVLAMLRT